MNSMAIVKRVPMSEAYVSVLHIQSLNDIPRAVDNKLQEALYT